MDGAFDSHHLTFDLARADAGAMDAGLAREWLLTNGAGGYAMGTVLGCNTRRYHGLLVAAGGLANARPPVGRVVVLNQMWEQVILGRPDDEADARQTLDFSTLAFRDAAGGRIFAPRGAELLRSFDRGLSVTWRYRWGGIEFQRQLLLHWKQQAITLRYRVTGLDDRDLGATLRLRPMITLRDFHGMRHQHAAPAYELDDHGGEYFTIADAGQPSATLCLQSSHGSFRIDGGGHWWQRVYYGVDAERGQEDQEDYYVPCGLAAPIADGFEVAVTAALGGEIVEPIADMADRAAHLRPMVASLKAAAAQVHGAADDAGGDASATAAIAPGAGAASPDGLAAVFAVAADDFVVDRTIRGQELSTVLAGYPWFFDWGRDTFISLPGLLLCTGRHDEARWTLRAFADAIFDGLIPNRFDDYDDQAAHYNTVDASLWFIRAAGQYLDATGDDDAWHDWLAAACLRIVDAYITGANYGIVMDGDGLIAAGNAHTQLTWMDARSGDIVFTPRWGKAVEINALWHHALVDLSRRAAPRHAPQAATYEKLAKKVRRSFGQVFWNADAGCLFDHVIVEDDGKVRRDASIRPNQVLALSLPDSPLSHQRQQRVLAVVRDRLLTPAGLRTLPPDDPAYHGRYTGPQPQRDEAYHQGTIWPWLIGPFAEAVLRVGRFSSAAIAEARAALSPLIERMQRDAPGCLGQLSEIHEADTLRPVGCPAQAWSVAEPLRIATLLARAESPESGGT